MNATTTELAICLHPVSETQESSRLERKTPYRTEEGLKRCDTDYGQPSRFCAASLPPRSFLQAQDLTPEQEARILQRFPQADRDGDGKLSAKEIEPLRERLEKAQKKAEGKNKTNRGEHRKARRRPTPICNTATTRMP